MILFIFAENNKLGLVWYKIYFVLLAVLGCEEKEVLEIMDVVGEECCVICKSNTGDDSVSVDDTKLALLGGGCLLVVVKLVLVRGGDSSLFQYSGIFDRTHESPVKVTEGLSA